MLLFYSVMADIVNIYMGVTPPPSDYCFTAIKFLDLPTGTISLMSIKSI